MTQHRIVPLLKQRHPRIWNTLTNDQKRIALNLIGDATDKKTLSKAVKQAQASH